jgi:methionyl-tRNA formyltransferase
MPDPGERSLGLIFMGTAAFAVPSLQALAGSHHRLLRVYSQPPRPAGRGLRENRCPVHEAADCLGLGVVTPRTLRDPDVQQVFQETGADLAVVAAYGLLLPKPVLDAPAHGCINIHGSLLPRWRGASPIQHAILEGDSESGISVFQMEPGLDTGPVLAMERIAIGQGMTATDLHDSLAALAAEMIVPLANQIAAGAATAVPQAADGVTYARKLDRAAGRLDWTRPALALERQVRAFTPWPGCWTEVAGQRIRVLEAELATGSGTPGEVLDERLTVAAGEGALRLLRVQRAGGRPLDPATFLRGFDIPPGSRIG